MSNSPDVKIEIWSIIFENEKILVAQRPKVIKLLQGENPVNLAISSESLFSHSTSWRYDYNLDVILTFVNVVTSKDSKFIELSDYLDNKRENFEVLLHAIRHICFLTYTDPDFESLLTYAQIGKLRNFSPLPAGAIVIKNS